LVDIPKSIRVLGEIEDLSKFYASLDAVIVPIVFGGGIKVKAIEGFAENLPVFGTEQVSLGFSPELRKYINPIENLFNQIPSKIKTITPQEFETNFSLTTFQKIVREVLE